MAAVKPKDVMNSIALLKQQNGSTVPEITKFLRQSNFFTRATPATKLAIHRTLSRLCEQGLLTCKNSRYQANTLARTEEALCQEEVQEEGENFQEEEALCQEEFQEEGEYFQEEEALCEEFQEEGEYFQEEALCQEVQEEGEYFQEEVF
ncbi:hypothetical protein PR048_005825 [Dryococelus australis]|uniref:H15 domain-containing protein n=1 Tax=Dryococelus australis TaxID=614101 RepID=A0ABQ9I996_9NEOP|nr:hypothetical protein PR048_005825 [Dryococelus australis]